MKKVFFPVLMLCLCSIAFSQTGHHYSSAGETAFGIKGGVNLATYQSSIVKTTSNRTAYHFGALAHIHLSPMFALQPEVVYSSQGSKFTNYSSVDKLNYINVPVLLQFMTRSGLRLETGPQLGLLLSAKSENKSTNTEPDIKSFLKSTDVSWAFSLGYLTTSGFGLDARYNLGLTDISTVGQDIKNRVWQLGVFYQFSH